MRILLVTQYFYPENFKSNDIAFELVKKGYKVDVLTGIPNYPEGKYYKGYGVFEKRYQRIKGVRVFRALQTPRGRGSGIELVFNYLTFAFFGSVWAFLLSLVTKYKCIIVHETSPITQGYPAVLVKKMQRIPMYFWVLDIWPDAMKSGGGIKNQRLLNFVDSIVKFMYNNSDKILISSRGFRNLIEPKGNYSNKIEYFPNWSEDILKMDSNYPIPVLPDGFKILMAGNLGKSQNLDAVMKSVLLLREVDEIKWIFVGDGSMKKWLDNFIEQNNLQNIVYTVGKYPFESIPAFYQAADALLLTLKGEFPHLRQVVPARLQSYMAAGKPVVAMIDGGGAEIIREATCGYVVDGGDYVAFADMIKEKVITNKAFFETLGYNGRKYYELHFDKEKCIEHLCKIIEQNEN